MPETPAVYPARITTRKSKSDRTMLVVRSEIDAVTQLGGMPLEAIGRLKEVVKKLHAVEVELVRYRSASSAPDAGKIPEDWHNILQSSDKQDYETQRYLLHTCVNGEICEDDPSSPLLLSPKNKRRFGSNTSWTVDPAITLSSQVQDLVAKAGHIDFDALELAKCPEVNGKPIHFAGRQLMVRDGLLDSLAEVNCVADNDLFQQRVLKFLGEVDGLYLKDTIYHGSPHGADAMSSVSWFMRFPFMQARTHSLDTFLGLIAAAVHDIGHPGTSNAFQCQTMTSLALRYNDKSVLENHSIALTFETMFGRESLDWFSLVSREFEFSNGSPMVNLQQYSRRALIGMVLATDMTQHAKAISQVKNFLNDESAAKTPQDGAQESMERKLLLLETVLHAADLSNPCRPRKIMLSWTKRVLQEFWAQGDEERRRGLPISPLCDRASGMATVAKGQLGFIKFVIHPYLNPIVELMPGAKEASTQLAENTAFWEERDKNQEGYDQIFTE